MLTLLVFVAQAKKEQQEADDMRKEMGLDAEDSLVAMIQVRRIQTSITPMFLLNLRVLIIYHLLQ